MGFLTMPFPYAADRRREKRTHNEDYFSLIEDEHFPRGRRHGRPASG